MCFNSENGVARCIKNIAVGFPWWSSGGYFELSLPGAWVWSLVGKLRSHKLCCGKKKGRNAIFRNCCIFEEMCISTNYTMWEVTTQLDESPGVSTYLSLWYLLVSVWRIKYTKLLLVMYEAVILNSNCSVELTGYFFF